MAHKASCGRCPWELLLPTDKAAVEALAHHFADKHAVDEKGVRPAPKRTMRVPGRSNGRGAFA